ncbi:uncharacterized protein LOC135391187 [Ornithodoros turicata]|uniref:uncharacterized protein LOC135391187 n=1 Tax=Ornithodoros turicata TaxID=34597 RepID=UPI003138F62A
MPAACSATLKSAVDSVHMNLLFGIKRSHQGSNMALLISLWIFQCLATNHATLGDEDTSLSSAALETEGIDNKTLLYNYPFQPGVRQRGTRRRNNKGPQGRSGLLDIGEGDDIAELYTDGPLLDPYACRVKVGGIYVGCHVSSSDYTLKLSIMKQHYGTLPEIALPEGAGSCHSAKLKRAIGIVAVVDSCFTPVFYTRKPYHLHNVKGQLRYIVQDPPLYKQCVQEAICTPRSLVCEALVFALDIPDCLPRICIRTLLAFDPLNPDAGLFADEFPTKCDCNCFGSYPSFRRPIITPSKPFPRLPERLPERVPETPFPQDDYDEGYPGGEGDDRFGQEDFYPARRYPGNGKSSRIPTYTDAFKPFRDAARRRASKRNKPLPALPSVYLPGQLGVEYINPIEIK